MSKPTVAYERCPHCKADIGTQLHGMWVDRDYGTEYDMECPLCNQSFGVWVESVPSFRCSTETNEARERRALERVRARDANK